MIFTGKDGSIYEIPKERYAEFEVSPQRAKEILDMAKSMNKLSSNNEVAGYMNEAAFGVIATVGAIAAVTSLATRDPGPINQYTDMMQKNINTYYGY
ncbi:hypothetical protein [Brachyspira pulli]|uniref:hypothetical protein n=1 Tax=Brachyspira pulli TaxID=310721 RepID=UPI003005DB44